MSPLTAGRNRAQRPVWWRPGGLAKTPVRTPTCGDRDGRSFDIGRGPLSRSAAFNPTGLRRTQGPIHASVAAGDRSVRAEVDSSHPRSCASLLLSNANLASPERSLWTVPSLK